MQRDKRIYSTGLGIRRTERQRSFSWGPKSNQARAGLACWYEKALFVKVDVATALW